MKYLTFTTLSILLQAYCLQSKAQVVTEFGNTSLGFTTAINVALPGPTAARLADLDGDGDLDAVIANGTTGFSATRTGFTSMLNTGNGRFGTPQSYPTNFESGDIVVADFTGDSIPDVAVSNTGTNYSGNTISLFPGIGNGT